MMKIRNYVFAAVSLIGCLMASAKPTDTSSPAPAYANDRGYRWSLDINACVPLKSQSLASSLISTTQGYQFNSKLYLGAGF